MPNRVLRDWTDSDRFDGISAEAERLFVRLLMKVDDYGRFHAEPRRLKAALFPLIEGLRQDALIRWLDELSTRQLVLLYSSSDHRQLLAIPRFGQRLKQSVPKFPPPSGMPDNWLPDGSDAPVRSAGILPSSSDPPEVPGTSRKSLPSSSDPPEVPARDGDGDGDGDGDERARAGRKPSAARSVSPPLVSASDLIEAGFDAAVAGEFIAHKARMKAPLTLRAWKLHIAEAQKAGWTPQAAAERVMAKGWKGFEARYVAGAPGGGDVGTSSALNGVAFV